MMSDPVPVAVIVMPAVPVMLPTPVMLPVTLAEPLKFWPHIVRVVERVAAAPEMLPEIKEPEIEEALVRNSVPALLGMEMVLFAVVADVMA